MRRVAGVLPASGRFEDAQVTEARPRRWRGKIQRQTQRGDRVSRGKWPTRPSGRQGASDAGERCCVLEKQPEAGQEAPGRLDLTAGK